jgi:hypothetical protein
MEEGAHDPVPRRPVVALAGEVVDAEVCRVERRLTALDAETHDRKSRCPNDSPIVALPGLVPVCSWEGIRRVKSCSDLGADGSSASESQ